MSKEQISNDLADKIVEVLHTNTVLSNYPACYVKKILKDHNLIKESALEKARRLKENLFRRLDGLSFDKVLDLAHIVYIAYEAVITEKDERIKELEEGKK